VCFSIEIYFVFVFKKPVEAKPAPAAAADDDDVDLFGSDDEEANEETKKRLAEYAAKKAKSTDSKQTFKSILDFNL